MSWSQQKSSEPLCQQSGFAGANRKDSKAKGKVIQSFRQAAIGRRSMSCRVLKGKGRGVSGEPSGFLQKIRGTFQKIRGILPNIYNYSWWVSSHPFEKYAQVKWDHFPE